MKNLSAREIIKILNSAWLSSSDVQLIACCGKNRALEIKREVKLKMEENGLYCPRNYISSEALLDHLKLDLDFLKNISNIKGANDE